MGAAGTRPALVDLAAQPLRPGRARTTGATGRPRRRRGRRASGRPRAAARPGHAAALDVGPVDARRGSRGSTTASRSSSRRRAAGASASAQLLLARAEAADEARAGRRRRARRAARAAATRSRPGSRKSGESGSSLSRLTTARSAVEERQDGGVPHQRQVVGGHLDGHAGRGQRAAQRRDAGAARAHQHGHPVPGDAVLEVGAAQQVGQPLGLGALGVVGEHLDAAVALRARARPPGERNASRASASMLPVSGQPAGDPAGGRAAAAARTGGCAAAPRRAPGAPPAVGKLGREVEDAAHVGAAEAVDRLVGVAHHGEVAAVAGERAQQRDLAGVGVLVLVDEDVASSAPAARRGGPRPR